MSFKRPMLAGLTWFALLAIAIPQPVLACAACFGRSDSRLALAFNFGILSLLVVVGSVLAGIAVFFVYHIRRASMLAAKDAKTPGASK